MADAGLSCPKCGSGAYTTSGCVLCGYLPGLPVRVHERPAGNEGEGPVADDHTKRIREGLVRAQAQGKQIGRPPTPFNRTKALALRRQGLGIKTIARQMRVSRRKIERELAKADGKGPRESAPPAAPPRSPEKAGVNTAALKARLQEEIRQLQEALRAIETVERLAVTRMPDGR